MSLTSPNPIRSNRCHLQCGQPSYTRLSSVQHFPHARFSVAFCLSFTAHWLLYAPPRLTTTVFILSRHCVHELHMVLTINIDRGKVICISNKSDHVRQGLFPSTLSTDWSLNWKQSSFAFEVKKVKCTLVQALRLCTGRTAHRGSRGIALPFHDHGTRRGEGSASHPGRSLHPGKSRYLLYRRLGGPQVRSGQVWKISPPPGFDSPDRPARSQSLYRLS